MGYLHIRNLSDSHARDILLFRRCFAMEKIRGTSAHVGFKRIITAEGPAKIEVHYFSGGEKHANFVTLFDDAKLRATFDAMGVQEVTIYGEAYGGSQQGMRAVYGDKLKFVAFDVLLTTTDHDSMRACLAHRDQLSATPTAATLPKDSAGLVTSHSENAYAVNLTLVANKENGQERLPFGLAQSNGSTTPPNLANGTCETNSDSHLKSMTGSSNANTVSVPSATSLRPDPAEEENPSHSPSTMTTGPAKSEVSYASDATSPSTQQRSTKTGFKPQPCTCIRHKCWLNVTKAEKVAKDFGLDFVFYEETATDIDALDAARNRESTQAVRNGCGPGKKTEGVVLRPLEEFTRNNGDRIIVKYKNPDFSERKSGADTKLKDPAKLEMMTKAQAIADEFVTDMRLSHVLDKIPAEQQVVENMKGIIDAMIEDVLREGASEIADSKEVRGAIGRATAILFRKRMNESLRAQAATAETAIVSGTGASLGGGLND